MDRWEIRAALIAVALVAAACTTAAAIVSYWAFDQADL